MVCILLLQLFLVVLLLPLHKHLAGILTKQVLRYWMNIFARELLLVALHVSIWQCMP